MREWWSLRERLGVGGKMDDFYGCMRAIRNEALMIGSRIMGHILACIAGVFIDIITSERLEINSSELLAT